LNLYLLKLKVDSGIDLRYKIDVADKPADNMNFKLCTRRENGLGNNSVEVYTCSFNRTQSYQQCREVMDELLEIPRNHSKPTC